MSVMVKHRDTLPRTTTGTLNIKERVRFDQLEARIQNHLDSHSEFTAALVEIRDKRFYRETHQTFERYCEERWRIRRNMVYKTIDHHRTLKVIASTSLPQPTAERQTRPMNGLDDATKQKVWEKAVHDADGNVPTGYAVEKALAVLVPERAKKSEPKPPPEILDAFDKTGGSPNKEIDAACREYLKAARKFISAEKRSKPLASHPELQKAAASAELKVLESLRRHNASAYEYEGHTFVNAGLFLRDRRRIIGGSVGIIPPRQ